MRLEMLYDLRPDFSSYLLTDQRSQLIKLGAAGIFIGRYERLITDAHGADIKLLQSDISAF